ncbi:hypothetical protein GW915_06250 [bacterium]|nr:hypothetical protein [bacterium]
MSNAKRQLVFHAEDVKQIGQRRRGRIRFKPDHNTIAFAKPLKESSLEFDSFVGLVVDESHAGCKVAFLDQVPFTIGDKIHLSLGKLPTAIAEVKWRKKSGSALAEVGFEYCD